MHIFSSIRSAFRRAQNGAVNVSFPPMPPSTLPSGLLFPVLTTVSSRNWFYSLPFLLGFLSRVWLCFSSRVWLCFSSCLLYSPPYVWLCFSLVNSTCFALSLLYSYPTLNSFPSPHHHWLPNSILPLPLYYFFPKFFPTRRTVSASHTSFFFFNSSPSPHRPFFYTLCPFQLSPRLGTLFSSRLPLRPTSPHPGLPILYPSRPSSYLSSLFLCFSYHIFA